MLCHTLVFSDVHLTTLVEARADGWLAYRRAELAPDALLARVIGHAHRAAQRERAAFELVFAGDLFDLDAPPECGEATVCTYGDCRTDAGAAEVAHRVLTDHPAFVGAVARVLADDVSSRVVFLPGNHDAQLAFLSVRHAIATALRSAALTRRLAFRSWFHRSADGRVIVEHGHQYDSLCVMDRMFARIGPAGTATLEDTVGTVGTHFGQALFGLLNPYSPFEFSERSRMMRACIRRAASDVGRGVAALAAFRELVTVRADPPAPSELAGWLAFVARETGLPRSALERHCALWAPKADVSELAYAVTGSSDHSAAVSARVSSSMEAVADLYDGTRAVVTGHTHEPFAYTDAMGRLFANAGSWTPPSKPGQPAGTFISIVSDPHHLAGALRTVWPDGSVS